MKKRRKTINLDKIISRRIKFLKIIIFIFFVVILSRLSYLTIVRGDYYKMLLHKNIDTYVYGGSAPRGRIYDCNNKLLVDNKAIKKIYYQKLNNITPLEEIEMAYSLVDILDLPYEELLNRNLKEFYLIKYEKEGNKKITKEEYLALENRKITEEEIYELKIERITEEDLSIFNEKDKKTAYLYYLMNKGYYNDSKIIKEDNVSDYEYAFIGEHSDKYKGFSTKLDWERVYLYKDTLKSILGTVSSSKTGIPKEKKNYYLNLGYDLDDRVGISGIEEEYESVLQGKKAKYKVNDDGSLTLVSKEEKGHDLVLSIDIDLQKSIEKIVDNELIKTKKEPNTKYYNRSFVVIENPNTGEIMAMVGRQILKNNHGKYEIYDYSIGNITSTVTPGSVVKGASILVGYNTKVIDIGTKMYDSCIKFVNMPKKCSWTNLGTIDDIGALKWSSNVYQFKIAMMVGGLDYKYNSVLKLNLDAFNIYRSTFYQFGLGVKTGIDFPLEENGYGGLSNDADLLINYAIGQYDTYTPLQLSQYVTTIANGGSRLKPHFLKKIINDDGTTIKEVSPVVLNELDTEEKYIKRIQKGFRECMISGTGIGYMGSSPTPSGKTGTSESFVDPGTGIYNHPTMSNNFVGYAPSNNPVMSIIVSSPDVQDIKSGSYKSDVNYRISRASSNAFFTLYNEKGERKQKKS